MSGPDGGTWETGRSQDFTVTGQLRQAWDRGITKLEKIPLGAVSGGMDGKALTQGGRAPSRVCGETSSPGDLLAKVELFLFQGQKGDPGLSPGQAHDGAKVGSRDSSVE